MLSKSSKCLERGGAHASAGHQGAYAPERALQQWLERRTLNADSRHGFYNGAMQQFRRDPLLSTQLRIALRAKSACSHSCE